MDLGLRNVPNADVVHRARVPFACHDDLLPLGENKKTCADYKDDPRGVKSLNKDFYGPYSVPGGRQPQYLVGRQNPRTRYAAGSPLFAPGTCRRGRGTRSRTPRQMVSTFLGMRKYSTVR